MLREMIISPVLWSFMGKKGKNLPENVKTHCTEIKKEKSAEQKVALVTA